MTEMQKATKIKLKLIEQTHKRNSSGQLLEDFRVYLSERLSRMFELNNSAMKSKKNSISNIDIIGFTLKNFSALK